jgi:hypothetical protein
MIHPRTIFKTAIFSTLSLSAGSMGEGRSAFPKDRHFFVWPVCYAVAAKEG